MLKGARRSASEPAARNKIRKRGMARQNSLFVIKSLLDSCSSLEDSLPDVLVVFLFCSLLNAKLYSFSNKILDL